MTTLTDQFVDIAKRSQGAVTTAAHSWAETVQAFTGNLTSGPTELPDAQAYIDTYFDFVANVLANQREIAHQWVTAARKATEVVTEQTSRATESFAAHGVQTADAVAESTAEATRVASQKAAPSTGRSIGN